MVTFLPERRRDPGFAALGQGLSQGFFGGLEESRSQRKIGDILADDRLDVQGQPVPVSEKMRELLSTPGIREQDRQAGLSVLQAQEQQRVKEEDLAFRQEQIQDKQRLAQVKEEQKLSKDQQSFFEGIQAAGEKADSIIESADRGLELMETGKGALFGAIPISGPIAGHITPFGKTSDQLELENLQFKLVRGSFKTFPRIKSEFDKIVSTTPGLFFTKDANVTLFKNAKKAAIFAKKKLEFVNREREKGISDREIAITFDKRFGKEKERLEKEINRDLRMMKKSAKKVGDLSPEESQAILDNMLFGG